MLATPVSKLQIRVVREISADRASVFDVLTSEAGMRKWIALNRRVEWRHPAGSNPPGVGSVRYIVLAGGILAAERILAWDPGFELHYTFDESSLPVGRLTGDYTGVTRLETIAPGRTRLTWSIHFDGTSRLAAAVARAALAPAIGLMVRNIARISESGARL